VCRADIGPFTEVALAQDHRAGASQLRHQRRIGGRVPALERQRAGRGHHAIGRFDVVLDQHRQAVQRTARLACGAFAIAQARASRAAGLVSNTARSSGLAVKLGDAVKVVLGQLRSADAPGLHVDEQFRGGSAAGDAGGRGPVAGRWRSGPTSRQGGRQSEEMASVHVAAWVWLEYQLAHTIDPSA
jgi:hypothetical protein